MGTLYIGHFAEKIGNPSNPRFQAQHYLGYAEPSRKCGNRWISGYDARVQEHMEGRGAKITRYVIRRGIPIVFFPIKRKATRDEERKLKRAGHYNRLCPVCQQLAQDAHALDEAPF